MNGNRKRKEEIYTRFLGIFTMNEHRKRSVVPVFLDALSYKYRRRVLYFSVDGGDVAENGRRFPQAEGWAWVEGEGSLIQQTSETSGRRNKQSSEIVAFIIGVSAVLLRRKTVWAAVRA